MTGFSTDMILSFVKRKFEAERLEMRFRLSAVAWTSTQESVIGSFNIAVYFTIVHIVKDFVILKSQLKPTQLGDLQSILPTLTLRFLRGKALESH